MLVVRILGFRGQIIEVTILTVYALHLIDINMKL